MMKKLCLLIVFNFTLSVCYAKHFNKLEISYSEFRPNFSIQIMNNMFEVCDVKISIKNVSNSPVFFWSWHRHWVSNFRLSNNNIYLIHRYISDAPACCLILPGFSIKYNGLIYFKKSDSKYLSNNQEILFLFYDALKYSREDYLRKDYILTDSINKRYNEYKIIADTIKCKMTEIYQLW